MTERRHALEQTQTNGRNGSQTRAPVSSRTTMPEASPSPRDYAEARRALIVLAVAGSIGDAQSLYFTMPGANWGTWNYLERQAQSLRSYVLDGDPPYVRTEEVDIWAGVLTPQGDCAEDAMPAEYANPQRREAEQKWFERKN